MNFSLFYYIMIFIEVMLVNREKVSVSACHTLISVDNMINISMFTHQVNPVIPKRVY